MPTDRRRSGPRLGRRELLQSIVAAGAWSPGFEAVRAEHEIDSRTPADVPTVRGSVEQVLVTDSVPGATITLQGPAGETVADATADEIGSYAFREITPATGYQVRQAADGTTSPWSEPVSVLAPDDHPDQAFYDQQTIEAGFGYLETRDGTNLAMNVSLPDDAEPPYPVLMVYSGYAPSSSPQLPDLAGALGYATVGVNIRGTQCSGGKFDFWERLQWLDGYDAVEAIAAQSWADGVGLVGASYSGYSQLFVAATQPPSLAAILPGSPVMDFYRDVGYPGGILNSAFATNWAAGRDEGMQAYPEESVSRGDVHERLGEDPVCHDNHKLRLQNRSTLDRLEDTDFATTFYRDRAPWHLAEQIEVPTLLVVSWQDEQVGSRPARLLEQFPDDTPVRFIGSNGDHGIYGTVIQNLVEFLDLYVAGKAGASDSNRAAIDEYESADPYRIQWEADQDHSSRWERSYAEWPPGETWRLYLQPDGTLGESPPPADSGFSSYEYEPRERTAQQLSRDDQGRLEWAAQPADSSVAFVTEELSQDRVCLGSAMAELWLRSTAADTDVQVTLSEVRPDGTEQFVQEGWLRASHRAEDEARSKPRRPWHTHLPGDQESLPDGEFARLRVELYPFGHVFREGSRIKFAIENPGGNRDRWAFDVIEEAATNDIGHAEAKPSNLALPLVAGEEAGVADRPDCGAVRHQPCRPVEVSDIVDQTARGDDEAETSTENAGPVENGSADGTAYDSGPGFTLPGTIGTLATSGYLFQRRNRQSQNDE